MLSEEINEDCVGQDLNRSGSVRFLAPALVKPHRVYLRSFYHCICTIGRSVS